MSTFARHALSRRMSPLSRSVNRCVSTTSAIDHDMLTPDEIVDQLSKFIVGQHDAKKAVAIALRSRWRRRQLPDAIREEVSPFNILMSGPTGTGKTEISRRLATMTQSPFIKVEATKFTEVGIYGQNVDAMVKDLVEVAVEMEKQKAKEEQRGVARARAVEVVLDELCGPIEPNQVDQLHDGSGDLREVMREQLLDGKLDDRMVDIPSDLLQMEGGGQAMLGRMMGQEQDMLPPALEDMMRNLNDMLNSQRGNQQAKFNQEQEEANVRPVERMSVSIAMHRLVEAEAESLVAAESEALVQAALVNAQENGIVFLDEVDKLATRESEASTSFKQKGEGVQKELLALVEGCWVSTKHGAVRTDHMLFIASGAFHKSAPSDLLPELQGRLPIRVNLSALEAEDFERILSETQFSLVEQTVALLETEGVDLTITPCAIKEIASFSAKVNASSEDIGARRLHTVVSKVMEDISFSAHRLKAAGNAQQTVDSEYVRSQLNEIAEKEDLARYIL